MPGVPSSRGCEACRKRKKKCDLTRPSCARCSRLRIPCVGAGQQRFMFKKQSFSGQESESAASDQIFQSIVPVTPCNKVSMTTSSLISILQVKDARFALSIYGDFVDQIPQRLGISKALDAAVVAFTTAIPYVYTHEYSANMYSSYANALKSTRISLSDPAESQTPETLCAIYLLMVCQGWIGRRDDTLPKHGEALALLLNRAVVQNLQSAFERDLVTTLAFITVLESFSNPNIKLDEKVFALTEVAGPHVLAEHESHIDSLHIRNVARMSKLLQQPDSDLIETQSIYRLLQNERIKMFAMLCEISKLPPSEAACNIQVRVQMGYALLLAFALLFNAVLRLFESIHDFKLVDDAALFVDEAVSTAKQAAQYRPLGSSSMPLCLIVAWAVSDHDELRIAEVEDILREYQLDFGMAKWLESAQFLRAQLHNPLAGSIVSKPPGILGFSCTQMGRFDVRPTEEGEAHKRAEANPV